MLAVSITVGTLKGPLLSHSYQLVFIKKNGGGKRFTSVLAPRIDIISLAELYNSFPF